MRRIPRAGGQQPTATTEGDDDRPGMPAADQVIDALRVFAADSTDITHHLARWLGVSAGDAEAFGEVLYAQDRGTPMSPGALSRRIGLSSGATGSLLNRLETAGLLIRSREHRDRRMVTLRIVPAVRAQAVGFFQPVADRVDAMMKEHPEELLRTVVALLDQLHLVTAEVLDNLEVPALSTQPPAGLSPATEDA